MGKSLLPHSTVFAVIATSFGLLSSSTAALASEKSPEVGATPPALTLVQPPPVPLPQSLPADIARSLQGAASKNKGLQAPQAVIATPDPCQAGTPAMQVLEAPINGLSKTYAITAPVANCIQGVVSDDEWVDVVMSPSTGTILIEVSANEQPMPRKTEVHVATKSDSYLLKIRQPAAPVSAPAVANSTTAEKDTSAATVVEAAAQEPRIDRHPKTESKDSRAALPPAERALSGSREFGAINDAKNLQERPPEIHIPPIGSASVSTKPYEAREDRPRQRPVYRSRGANSEYDDDGYSRRPPPRSYRAAPDDYYEDSYEERPTRRPQYRHKLERPYDAEPYGQQPRPRGYPPRRYYDDYDYEEDNRGYR